MSGLAVFLDAFHFLRPLWLLLLLPALGLWVAVRRGRGRRDLRITAIAPHLRAALTVGDRSARRLQPIDAVAAALLLLTLGAAGPTWSRMPDPTGTEAAPVAVLISVTPAMLASDVAPSRLERGKQKIRDFLDLRGGARTGLIAYAGTAHVVVPMTADSAIMVPYLAGLAPDIMPRPGNRAAEALALAQSLLAGEGNGAAGAVLIVTDSIDPADAAALNAAPLPVAVLSLLPEGARDRGIDALSLPVVEVTPDGSDVTRLDRVINTAWREALLRNSTQPWLDRGPWLAWPAALILCLWFRRGWTMRWAVVVLALLAAAPQGRAEDQDPGLASRLEAEIAGWFWTPDQQGQRAMERHDYEAAAAHFLDPYHRGYALYRDGQYAEAVAVLDRLDTPEAATLQGISHIRLRAYRDAVEDFRKALSRAPGDPVLAANLATAEAIVDYVERVQEQSDTGDTEEMKPDEVAFDNKDNRGQDTEVPVPQTASMPLSADQWMSGVDTETGDFLRQRFALEAARGNGSGGNGP